eukprot:6214280-Pleurochrysis_carterae.AAC.1
MAARNGSSESVALSQIRNGYHDSISERCRDRNPAPPEGESFVVIQRRYRQGIRQDVPCCGVDPQATNTCYCSTVLQSYMIFKAATGKAIPCRT